MAEQHTHSKGPIAAYFVPMGIGEKAAGKMRCPVDGLQHTGQEETGVHVLDTRTRGDILNEWIGDDLATAYKSHALTLLLGIGAIAAFLWVHWALAAALAYGAGYTYSRYLFMYAWSIQWYKGKSLMYTE